MSPITNWNNTATAWTRSAPQVDKNIGNKQRADLQMIWEERKLSFLEIVSQYASLMTFDINTSQWSNPSWSFQWVSPMYASHRMTEEWDEATRVNYGKHFIAECELQTQKRYDKTTIERVIDVNAPFDANTLWNMIWVVYDTIFKNAMLSVVDAELDPSIDVHDWAVNYRRNILQDWVAFASENHPNSDWTYYSNLHNWTVETVEDLANVITEFDNIQSDDDIMARYWQVAIADQNVDFIIYCSNAERVRLQNMIDKAVLQGWSTTLFAYSWRVRFEPLRLLDAVAKWRTAANVYADPAVDARPEQIKKLIITRNVAWAENTAFLTRIWMEPTVMFAWEDIGQDLTFDQVNAIMTRFATVAVNPKAAYFVVDVQEEIWE